MYQTSVVFETVVFCSKFSMTLNSTFSCTNETVPFSGLRRILFAVSKRETKGAAMLTAGIVLTPSTPWRVIVFATWSLFGNIMGFLVDDMISSFFFGLVNFSELGRFETASVSSGLMVITLEPITIPFPVNK